MKNNSHASCLTSVELFVGIETEKNFKWGEGNLKELFREDKIETKSACEDNVSSPERW